MVDKKLERISLDVSNYCSKACSFCYNHSSKKGSTFWKPNEIIRLAIDCSENGVKAFSLGGGEPLEYEGIYDVISAIKPHLFVSITSNGLPLSDKVIFSTLLKNPPNKIHITIHNPSSKIEVSETIKTVKKLIRNNINAGINILVSSNEIPITKQLTTSLYKQGFTSNQIIFVPRKFEYVPTCKEVAEVAVSPYFQSASCLSDCKISKRFCSISWDKKVGFCSYTPSKASLDSLDYFSINKALNSFNFKTCIE